MIKAAWASLAGYVPETPSAGSPGGAAPEAAADWSPGLSLPAMDADPAAAEADAGLTPAESARAAAFRLRERRLQYLLGRRLLRLVAADVLGLAPGRIALPAEGRPAIADAGKPVWLTLSHSGSFAIAAASDEGPVGADLERTGQERDWTGLAAGLRWPAEAAAKEGFLRLWTLREAEFKAGMREGEGFAWQALTADFCLSVVARTGSPWRWRGPGLPGDGLRPLR